MISNWYGSSQTWNVSSKSKDTCQETPSGRPVSKSFQLKARTTLVGLKRWFRDRQFNPEDSEEDSDGSDSKWPLELIENLEEFEDDSSEKTPEKTPEKTTEKTPEKSSQESSDKSLEDLSDSDKKV